MAEVAVIGGGMAGLTAGYYLRAQDVPFTLFEASDRVGGKVLTTVRDGHILEFGPHTLQRPNETLSEMMEALALDMVVQEADPAARARYIVRGGRPVAVPDSLRSFTSTPLLSTRAKLRLMKEPFVRRGPAGAAAEMAPAAADAEKPRHGMSKSAGRAGDESVADFIRRRFGREVLDYAANPFIAGIYGGDPEELSMRHAFPRLYRMERDRGSILTGMLRKAAGKALARLGRKTNTGSHGERRTSAGGPISFNGGMSSLPRTIADEFSDCIRLRTPALDIRRHDHGWTVEHSEGVDDVEAVIITTPPQESPFELPFAGDVRYPPLSVAALAYPKDAVGHPLDGFGLLVPEVEDTFRILGTLFSSTLFPTRAPAGHALLTSFVGGSRAPERADLPDEEFYALVDQDLRRLLDISAEPVFKARHRWAHAIPQYNIGYDDILEQLRALERAHAGLYFAGNYRGGVSLGDAAQSGRDAAERYHSGT